MRITPYQKNHIMQIIHDTFGSDAEVWLFGSRVDDAKKGGDVDLYVEAKNSDWFDAKIKAIQQLEMLLPYPVDIVVKEDSQNLAIYSIAKAQGIKL